MEGFLRRETSGGIISGDVHIKERPAFRSSMTQAERSQDRPEANATRDEQIGKAKAFFFFSCSFPAPALSLLALSAAVTAPGETQECSGGSRRLGLVGNSSSPGCWPLSILALAPVFLGRPVSDRRPFRDTFITCGHSEWNWL